MVVMTWPLRIMMLAWKGLVEVSVAHRAHAVPVGMEAIGSELLLLARRCSMACATSSTLPSPPQTMTTSNFPSSSAIIISYLHRRSHLTQENSSINSSMLRGRGAHRWLAWPLSLTSRVTPAASNRCSTLRHTMAAFLRPLLGLTRT